MHAMEIELPQLAEPPVEKKSCEYLYIEADEDHIHCQKAGKEQGCFIGKLVYLFEGKEEVCKGRRKLISPFYFGGLYAGTDQNAALWETVDAYIQKHYDQDALKCVYINSDGAGWIKAADPDTKSLRGKCGSGRGMPKISDRELGVYPAGIS